ncbi:hypothetical protein [Streptomyces sp. SID13031]|uniref:hypothetical protein n=1 Tax=Streptomyces sp. SID13031 TaxID=2706046 RepID=UPI0013C841D7|nr:hypothetical protein [Streptomyces sp. SID13031]NEA31310.1 hypothetical protein [Streptomyces sp. SID13031]
MKAQLAAARLLVAGVGLLAVVAGCSSSPAAGPSSSPPTTAASAGGTVPIPTNTLSTVAPTDAAQPPELPEQATAPPPAAAGPVSSKNLPAPAKLGTGWKTYTDPGGAEAGFVGNETWTRSRAPQQAAYEALPVGCGNPLPTSSLPVPEHALQGSYLTGAGKPATVLVLRFADAGRAKGYYGGYQARMAACGAKGSLQVKQLWSSSEAAASVRSYEDAESFVEVSALKGSTVALLAQSSTTPDTQAAWARSVVPALEAVIDLP